MLKYFFFSVLLGLSFSCTYSQSQKAETVGHAPKITTKASPSLSLAEQVKHLELRLERLKARTPAPTAEELQKVETQLAQRRAQLATQQEMIEKRQTPPIIKD